VNDQKFFNPHMAQTLVSVQMLFYINAALTLLLSFGALGPLGLLEVAIMAGSAYGIANERRWGYILAMVTVVLSLVVILLYIAQGGTLFNLNVLLAVLFRVALTVLVFHPESREYQRIWFK
jgi:hypothetical protein